MLCTVFANAQTYQPLPDSNAVWLIKYDDGFGGYGWQNYYTPINQEDTIINAKTYSKIYKESGGIFYTGAFRSDTLGKTFFVPKDSSQEYLLQDMSKNTGDSVYNVYYGVPNWNNYQINFYVDSVDYITIGPYLLKRMFLRPAANSAPLICGNGCMFPLVWIEKIGSLGGGFYNGIIGGLAYSWLNCMSYNDTIYYNNSSPGQDPNTLDFYTYGYCGGPLGLNESAQIYEGIALSPNPISNESNLKLNDEEDLINQVEIYNSLGEKIKENRNINNVKFQIKENEFSSGIYIVKIITKKRKRYSMKFMVL